MIKRLKKIHKFIFKLERTTKKHVGKNAPKLLEEAQICRDYNCKHLDDGYGESSLMYTLESFQYRESFSNSWIDLEHKLIIWNKKFPLDISK